MSYFNNASESTQQQFWEPLFAAPFPVLLPLIVAFVAYFVLLPRRSSGAKEPPRLWDVIPYISTAYQYLANQPKFLQRVKYATRHDAIVQFRLGPKRAYVVTGPQNVSTMFRTNAAINENIFGLLVMDKVWGMRKEELDMFKHDASGRVRVPAPGHEDMPLEKRQWFQLFGMYDDYLTNKKYANSMALKYYQIFDARLDCYPKDEWTEVRLSEMLKKEMTEAAVNAIYGDHILKLCPNFNDIYWEMDSMIGSLAFGLPQSLNPRPYLIRDKFHAVMMAYVDWAWENYDWNAPGADEAEWDEYFGARLNREKCKWLKANFCKQTAAGSLATFAIGTVSNSLPIAVWCLMEIIKDPELFKAVQAEILQTGISTIDPPKLLTLPLLQSVFTEIMRLHISINVLREVKAPMEIGGYNIKPGSILAAPTYIAHRDERYWSAEGHPTDEFWAERHLKEVETIDDSGRPVKVKRFSLANRSSSFLPFGGGVSMCPGRVFAKQEVLSTIAILFTRFDIEFLEWVNMDGTRSDRGPQNNPKHGGNAGMSPDRDIKVRWRRRW